MSDMILKGIARVLSPSGASARLSILIFHRVLTRPDVLFPGEPDLRRFNDVIGWVSKWFKVLPLDQAVTQLRSGELPARAAAITFDDGYADNATNALPVLQRHGVTATFFISTAFLDGGRMWNDSVIEAVRQCTRSTLDLRSMGLGLYQIDALEQRRYAIGELLRQIKYMEPEQRDQAVQFVMDAAGPSSPEDLMMRPEQVRVLRHAGMQIGAHTCSHPILERVGDQEAGLEITNSKAFLETVVGEPVTLFAYPNGKPDLDYSAKHVAMVKSAGFVAAVSTAPGVASSKSDFYQLPRFTPWDRTRMKYGVRMLVNMRRDTSLVARVSA